MVQRSFGKVLVVTVTSQDSQVQLDVLWSQVLVKWTNTIVDHLESVDMIVDLVIHSMLQE